VNFIIQLNDKTTVLLLCIVLVFTVTIIITVEEKITHEYQELRVAFIGDQGLGQGAIAVLKLIKDEGTHMVLHQGDFDYADDPDKWDKQISDVLGSDFPYFASIGNHDLDSGLISLKGYQEKLYDRLEKNPDAVCNGDLGVKSSCIYKGLFFILAAPGIIGSDYDSFIKKQLNDDDSMWRICSWHVDMREKSWLPMLKEQPLAEDREASMKEYGIGWEIFESCKNGGAIIANAHTHLYARSKTLINIENQIVDSEWSDLNKLRVKEGATFAFVSGVGGSSFVKHAEYYDWSTGYVPGIGSSYGALFCTFNAGGQPNKAYCYFKNVDGRIVDEFTVTSFLRTTPDYNNLIDTDMSGLDLAADDFSNKVIIDSNLSNAILVGADLSDAVLIGTTLMGANLTDANLTGVSLAYKDLIGTILRGADLTDANLTGVSLAYKDLTGTILRGADLTDTNLTGIDLSGRDLTGTILRGMDLSDKDLTGTILRGADLTDTNLTGIDLSGRDLTGTILRGMDLSDKDLTGTILRGADLTDTNLTGIDLSGWDLTGTILRGMDLSDRNLSESKFSHANFIDANLQNANLASATFVDVDLTKIKNKSLAGADLTGTSFAHSNLSGVNLSGTILKGTNFWKANLSGVDFTVTDGISERFKFMDANLSNSNFEGVDLSPKKIFFNVFKNKAYLMGDQTQSSTAEQNIKNELFRDFHVLIIYSEVRGNDLAVNYIYYNTFVRANLENINFKNATLWHANFYSANLTNADLSGADLRKSLLFEANLEGANLEGANLEGANLEGANLEGANLEGANLEGANLNGVYTNGNTILKCKNHPICNG